MIQKRFLHLKEEVKHAQKTLPPQKEVEACILTCQLLAFQLKTKGVAHKENPLLFRLIIFTCHPLQRSFFLELITFKGKVCKKNYERLRRKILNPAKKRYLSLIRLFVKEKVLTGKDALSLSSNAHIRLQRLIKRHPEYLDVDFSFVPKSSETDQ